jgi:hypothetical protein
MMTLVLILDFIIDSIGIFSYMHICVNMNLIFFHSLQDYEADTHSSISGVSGVSSENYPLLSKSPIQPILFGHEQGSRYPCKIISAHFILFPAYFIL